MKHLKLKHYSDAGHGWIAMKRTVLVQLGILGLISPYSYQSKTGQTVYLEEDSDASKLISRLKTLGVTYEIETIHSDRSHIRSLPQFETQITKEAI